MNSTPTTRAAQTTRANAERRSRPRLRELCDEVLASYRAARDADPISATERAEAAQLLARMGALR